MKFNTFAGAAAAAALLAFALPPGLALAGPQGHGSASRIGAPGAASEATRTIEISLKDNYYEPESVSVKAGETVRFTVKNDGDLVHEFAIATAEMHVEHRPMMQMMVDHGVLFPERVDYAAGKAMQKAMGHGMHDEPNSLLLEPGESGELIWTFPAGGELEFHELGLGEPLMISAEHGHGVTRMLMDVLEGLPEAAEIDQPDADADDRIRVAIVGRPNVGKSTLVNKLIGEPRLLAADMPGTTRDAIEVDFEHEGTAYTFIDTAGVRRRARVREAIEKFSIIKTLQAIDSAHVVIMMVDARGDIGEQDARLMGLIAERGRGMVLAVNKWDGLEDEVRDRVRSEVARKLPFGDFVPLVTTSAARGTGLKPLMKRVEEVHRSVTADLSTPELNRVLADAVARHQPPASLGRRTKLRFAHQGGKNPLKIVIHGNLTERLSPSYKRYLVNCFREHFGLSGIPLVLTLRTGDNPYKDRKNVLTQRQRKKRRRLMSHVKR